MIYFTNFDYFCSPLGVTLNIEASADEDQIKSVMLFQKGSSQILKEIDLPKHEMTQIYDAIGYQLDMQRKADEEKKGKEFSDRLWEIGSSMNRELVDWINNEREEK